MKEKLRRQKEKQKILEAHKQELKQQELMKKRQKEFKSRVINEYVKNTSRNKYTKCKLLF
jgi:hypothetical protein